MTAEEALVRRPAGWSWLPTRTSRNRPAGSGTPSTGTLRLVFLPLVLGLPMMALTVPAQRAGIIGADLVLQWVLHLVWGWWALRTARALHISLPDPLARPVDGRAWLYLLLVPVLLSFAVSALLVQTWSVAQLLPALKRFLLAIDPADESTSPALRAMSALTGATLVATVEEVVFRGVLLRSWMRRVGPGRAVIATSLLFGLLHHDPIGSVAFGLVLAVVHLRTGTLLLPIAMHAGYNALTGLASLSDSSDADQTITAADFDGLIVPSLLVMLGSLAVIVISMRLLGRAGGWRLDDAVVHRGGRHPAETP